MLSLSNAFNLDDMQDFYKKINNFLNFNDRSIELFCEPKIDGISATLIYENGILTKGLSRGDGKIGEDILSNLKTIKNLPKIINSKIFQISSKLDVKFISAKMIFFISSKFANPRNAAGVL